MSERRKDMAKWVTGWLDDDLSQDETNALRGALESDPDLLAAFLLEIRLDEQLARCLAGRDQRAPVPAPATPFSRPAKETAQSPNSGLAGMGSPHAGLNLKPSSPPCEQCRKKWAKIVAMAWADEG
jgi:ferric-dicitrate binding protein FerR (iron transport regulator)